MKKKLSIISSILLIGLMTACGQAEMEGGACENTLIPIEVDFSWDPENPTGGQNIQFTAHVTHDEFDVDEADDVKFEIWEHGNSDYHHMAETENQGNGLYTLDWTFQEDGVYYAYYHVTACSMHRMEKEMVVIGDVDVESITAQPDTATTKMEGNHQHEDRHEDHEEHHKDHEHHEHDDEEEDHQHNH